MLLLLVFRDGLPPEPVLSLRLGPLELGVLGLYKTRVLSLAMASMSFLGEVCIRRAFSVHHFTCRSNACKWIKNALKLVLNCLINVSEASFGFLSHVHAADALEVHVTDGRHVGVGVLLTVGVVPAANFL